MATHIFWQADVADFDAWHSVFKKDKMARTASGVIALNVWRDPDNRDRAYALYAATNLDHARAFFDSEELAMHREREGIANVEYKILIPA